MKRGIRQMLVSVGVFAIVLLGIVSVDPVVRERFTDLVAGVGPASVSQRSMELADSLGSALKHQSIENAPLLVFATVGAMLFVFMVKT